MSVIKANNFDISHIDEDTKFVLDTNILYYVHSGYYLPKSQESIKYSNIIQNIITSGHSIIVSSLNVQELLFGIENKEYQIYCYNNNLSPRNFSKKCYRKEKSERALIEAKLKTVLSELSIYELASSKIDISIINNFVDTFDIHRMDPIDYILAMNYDPQKTIFISEDKDFQTLTSIKVLTA